jgi:hypothetical protein
MKTTNLLLAAAALMGLAGLAEAGPSPKAGAWSVYYYEGPAQTALPAKTFCIKADATWTTGPAVPGNGGWLQDGNDVYFFGALGDAAQGAAFSAFGQVLGNKLIAGNYISFNAGPSPSGRKYGAFKAVFVRIACS